MFLLKVLKKRKGVKNIFVHLEHKIDWLWNL